MTDIDYSLLDPPGDGTTIDPDAFLQAAIKWHFSEATGSPFWLSRARELDFDPLQDVRGFADLRRFPNVVGELRTVAVEDLIPRGYGQPAPVPQIFESGGTTGAPKRTIQTPDWIERSVQWQTQDYLRQGYARNRGFLGVVPAGPHGVGHTARLVANRLGSIFHPIDIDPRWAKKLAARATADEAAAYVDHLVEQVGYILATQDIGNLFTTPPILTAMTRSDSLVDRVNQSVRFIVLGGAHLDPDTYSLFQEIFPRITITMVFGNTMILAPAITREAEPTDGVFVFDPRTPYVTFEVVDPESGEPVAVGDRGQVLAHHVSKVMFLPCNLERDSAIRFTGPEGQVGDSIGAVAPVEAFEGEKVIEGVY